MAVDYSVTISTQDVSPCDSKGYWERKINDYVVHVDCPFIKGDSLQAKLHHQDFDLLKVNHIRANAHSVQRSKMDILLDSRDDIFMCFMLEGDGFSYQNSECLHHMPGDLVIYDTQKPYGQGFPHGVDMLVLSIPRGHFQYSNDINMMKVDRGAKLAESSRSKILELLSTPPATRGDVADICDQILHHSNVLVDGVNINSKSKSKQVLYYNCKSYIDQNLTMLDLNIPHLCEVFSVSSRQLSRAFESSGRSLTRYIWLTRLEKCRVDIISLPSMSVTDIAFKWGFNHTTHFSRLYKQYYGESPTDTRKKKAH